MTEKTIVNTKIRLVRLKEDVAIKLKGLRYVDRRSGSIESMSDVVARLIDEHPSKGFKR